MYKETQGFGDSALATLNTNGAPTENIGIEGHYSVSCYDKDGNLKWEEAFPNVVTQVGKILMFDSFLKGSSYSVTGPFLGLATLSGSFSSGDTMTSHSGWTEFTSYQVGGSSVRGTAVFGSATGNNTYTTGNNVVTSAASAISFAINGSGTVAGCFLVTGSGATNAYSGGTETNGTLYSAGAFTGGSKTVASGDTLSVTYSTTATS